MIRQEVQRLLPGTEVVLKSPANWTAVWFFAALALLHFFVAANAFWNQQWGGFMSVIFGLTFAAVAVACAMVHMEFTLEPAGRRLRLRTGTHRIYMQRFIPFGRIESVRLTLLHPHRPQSARIELVCENEVIDCPPTSIPRAEALCLAVMTGARLIKIYAPAFGPASERMERLHLN